MADWRQALYGRGGATPHPTSFGGHLLPQGEKGKHFAQNRPNDSADLRRILAAWSGPLTQTPR